MRRDDYLRMRLSRSRCRGEDSRGTHAKIEFTLVSEMCLYLLQRPSVGRASRVFERHTQRYAINYAYVQIPEVLSPHNKVKVERTQNRTFQGIQLARRDASNVCQIVVRVESVTVELDGHQQAG